MLKPSSTKNNVLKEVGLVLKNSKIVTLLILFSSLIGYLEWGSGNTLFLFEAEAQVLAKLVRSPLETLHPLTILPLLGQLGLLINLIQKRPNKVLSISSILCLSLLFGLLFSIGIIALKPKIWASSLPFILFSSLRMWQIIQDVKPR